MGLIPAHPPGIKSAIYHCLVSVNNLGLKLSYKNKQICYNVPVLLHKDEKIAVKTLTSLRRSLLTSLGWYTTSNGTSIPAEMYPSTGDSEKSAASLLTSHLNLQCNTTHHCISISTNTGISSVFKSQDFITL